MHLKDDQLIPQHKEEGFLKPERPFEVLKEELLKNGLLDACSQEGENCLSLYNILNRVFKNCLNQHTSNNQLNFSGTFAQTDYLLRERKASARLCQSIHQTRINLRNRERLSQKELYERHLHDLHHLCAFIAFLEQTTIPVEFQKRCPAAEKRCQTATPKVPYLRICVRNWDSEFIYGIADLSTGQAIKIKYTKTNEKNDDWSYLQDLLYLGAQINLIHPYEQDEIIYPKLIVFEPDLLIEVSTIARCFTNYTESPLVHLLQKIQSSQQTESTLLGNFAGQLLDEQIHQKTNATDYKKSIQNFWKNSAFELTTTEIGPYFHEEAQKQKKNIHRALQETLPREVSGFQLEMGMVEPSFYSEMLGLQGRMDYLQQDFRLLLEQKSGKGEFPFDHFIHPRHKEEHYVQILLYMMIIKYNYPEYFQKNQQKISAFLLYSKYENSLLSMGHAPELAFRALKIRNELAHQEIQLAQENGFRRLETLTPEELNTKNKSNPLWMQHQVPQIEALLQPIHTASELEKAYYFRFLTFIANEHLLAKIGHRTKENSGFAAKWHDSLEEKLQAGNIYEKLTLTFPTADTQGSIETVQLCFDPNSPNEMANFRVGDIAILYPYDATHEPDARKTMVFRCAVSKIGTTTLELKLRAPQTDAAVLLCHSQEVWAVEHDFMETSFSPLYKGMHAFLSAPQERRDLLLLQRSPETDESRHINGHYGTFNELSTRVKRAKDLFLIIGPPGTGKTSFGMLNTLMEELTEPSSSVLLLSYTNRAVDEICSKLHQEGIEFIRIGGSLTASPEYHAQLLDTKIQHCKNKKELQELLIATRVFVATTSSMSSHLPLFQIKSFNLAIIDEASQILEPHLMGILSAHTKGVPAIQKIVLIGDHKQLPAVVQQSAERSLVKEPLLRSIHLTDCRLSLFERLLKQYSNDPSVVYMLKRQGRMHQEIAQFPSLQFYNNQLDIVPLPHQQNPLPNQVTTTYPIDDLLKTHRLVFLHCPAPQKSVSDKVNSNEAQLIARILQHIYQKEKKSFNSHETVGVIVPYRNQIATIRKAIDQLGIPPLLDISIDTIERYQGSQRKYIIYGFTIQKYYQLDFLTNQVFRDMDGQLIDRKLNVAMTRAKEFLFLVGNHSLLSRFSLFSQLIDFIRQKGGYREVSPETSSTNAH